MVSSDSTSTPASTWLYPDQVETLRTACYDERFQPALRQRNEALIAFAYDTGLRVGELVGMDVDALDFDADQVRVPEVSRAATQSSVTLPLDSVRSLGTVRLLKSYLYNRDADTSLLFPSPDGRRLSPRALRAVVCDVAAAGDVTPQTPDDVDGPDPVTIQTLRHSTAWRLLNVENLALKQVQTRLRHECRQTTEELYKHFQSRPSRSENPPISNLRDYARSAEYILSAIPDVLYAFDADGHLIWWNDRFTAQTGYSDAEVAEMSPLAFVPERDREMISEAIDRIIEDGTIQTRESHLVTKAGEHVPYAFNGAPIRDDSGAVVGFVGTGRDISARKHAERTAREQRERFELFVEEVSDYALFLVDPDGYIASWNEGAKRIKGYREEEILGEHLSTLYPRDAAAAGRPTELLERAAAMGRVEDEGWHVRKDGSRFWANAVITALYDDGTLRGFAKITRDMTDQRRRQREIRRQRDELAELNRINAIVRRIDQTLVRATSRTEIERAVCDNLSEVDPYCCAWIGELDPTSDEVRVRARAGLDDGDPSSIIAAVRESDSPPLPSKRALDSGETQVVKNLDAGAAFDACRARLDAHDVETVAAIPLTYRESHYGVLVIYSKADGTFDGRFRAVLDELGETIGHALAAIERKRALMTDGCNELTFEIDDGEQFFTRLTDGTGATLSLQGVVTRTEEPHLEYFSVAGLDPETVRTLATQSSTVSDVRVLNHQDGEVLCEVAVNDSSVVATLATHGAVVTEMRAEGGCGTVVVEQPQSGDVNRVVDAIRTVVPDVELRAKRTVDRPVQTDGRFRATVTEQLTEKQRTALRAAYFSGFFERPRLSTGQDVAESLDVAASTFHQHVRVGLRKLLGTALEDTDAPVRETEDD
jgi:PAS domain S-box-containing protein